MENVMRELRFIRSPSTSREAPNTIVRETNDTNVFQQILEAGYGPARPV